MHGLKLSIFWMFCLKDCVLTKQPEDAREQGENFGRGEEHGARNKEP